jgi:hypothetical protein
MKFHNSFKLIGSLAVLSAAQMASADESAAEPEIAICWEYPVPVDIVEEPIIIVCPGVDDVPIDVSIDPVIIEENGEGTFVEDQPLAEEEAYTEEEVTDGGGQEDSGSVYHFGEFEIPFDWIKRTGGDSPKIYSSLMNFSVPMPTSTGVQTTSETSPSAKENGSDGIDKAIESSEKLGVFKARQEKNSPVALVKEGRVFLR